MAIGAMRELKEEWGLNIPNDISNYLVFMISSPIQVCHASTHNNLHQDCKALWFESALSFGQTHYCNTGLRNYAIVSLTNLNIADSVKKMKRN